MTLADQLQALGEAATPGPWNHMGWHLYRGTRFTGTHEPLGSLVSDTEADATFIATARNLWPELVELVKAAEDERLANNHTHHYPDQAGENCGLCAALRRKSAALDSLQAKMGEA